MDNVIDPQERFDGENDLDSLFGNNTQSRNTSQGFDGESELDSLFGGSGTASKPVIKENAYGSPGVIPERSAMDVAGDTGIAITKGAVSAVQGVTGLVDLVTPGQFGKYLEDSGVDFQGTQQRLQEQYSPATQEAQRKVSEAEGVIDTAKTAIMNPSSIAAATAESLPSMYSGGAIGRVGGAVLSHGSKLLRGLGALPKTSKTMALAEKVLGPRAADIMRASAGEGLISSGQAAESIRLESGGTTTAQQDALAMTSGAMTGLISMVSGKVASKLGIADPDIVAAGGDVVEAAVKKGFPRRVVEGFVTEGFMEELPQSVQEAMLQNIATGKDPFDNIDQEAVMGALSGGVMGAGFNALSGSRGPKADATDIDMMQNNGGVIPQAQPYLGEEVAGGQDYDPVKYGMEQGQYGEVIPTMTQRPSLNDQPYEPAKPVQQTDMDMTGNAPTADAYLGEEIPGANPDLVRAGLQQGQYGEVIPTRPQPEPVINTELDAKAHEAATSPLNDKPIPTQEQAESGKYEKGKLKLHGLSIDIENPKGSTRSGVNNDGTEWSVTMPGHYGEIKRTSGADGDPVDVYIGDQQESQAVFIVDQLDADTGAFDEHKVIMGVETPDDAHQLYTEGFSDGRGGERFGGMAAMTVDQFKEWLKDGDQRVPVFAYNEESAQELDANEQETNSVVDQKAENVSDNGIAPERQEFINNKVKELGSVEAVDELYADDSPVSQYAKQRAREVFGAGEQAEALSQVEDNKDLSVIAESAIAAFPDMIEADGGLLALSNFTPEEQQSLRNAGIVSTATTSKGHEYEGVDAEYLWQRRKQIQDGRRARAEKNSIEKPESSIEQTVDTPESTNHQQNMVGESAVNTGDGDNVETFDGVESKPDQEKAAGFVGRQWKDRNGDTRQVVSIAEDRPDGWLMVSTEGRNSQHYIHVEDIQGEIDRDEANYKRNAEFLAETEKAEKKAAEDKAANEDIDGFHDDKSAMQRGRTIKALTGKQIRFSDGTIATPKERVRKLVESGELNLEMFQENKIKPMSRRAWNNSTQGEQDAHDAKVAAAGKKTIYLVNGSDLGKIAYDYAEYLQNKKLQNAERNSPVVNETAERVTKEQDVVKEKDGTLTKDDAKEKNGYGADNKLVSQDRAEELRKKLRAKLNQLNSGVDPEMLAMGTELAVYHIEAGARSFVKFARTVVAELGERAKPYLKSWYMGARYFPGLDSSGMDTAATVEALNIDDITDGVANAAEGDKVKSGEDYATDGGRYENTGSVGIQGAGESTGVQTEATGGIDEGGETASLPDGRTDQDNKGDHRTDNVGADGVRGSGDRSAKVREPATGTGSDGSDGERNLRGRRRVDYRITDADQIGEGGAKAKYKNNVAAIETLKTIQAENRQATPEEQAILAKYVGWGGLAQAFKRPDGSTVKGWEKEVEQLEALLTEEEYASAMRSTPNAHYTSPEIIKGMYQAVQRLGLSGGRALEPSVGAGNFLGLQPENMSLSFSGVELDQITGGIAKLLYPKQNLHVKGFQDFDIVENSIDLAIGNPPFGSVSLYDTKHKDLKGFSIHNFFFAKSIKALRPGGVLSMVVSNSMMDKAGGDQRAWMAERTRLLGAIRLPNNAFKKNAGTEVTTDIIFLQKLAEGEQNTGETWQDLAPFEVDGVTYNINEYFARHPEMMLGRVTENKLRPVEVVDGVYDGVSGLTLAEGSDFAHEYSRAINSLPENVYRQDSVVINQKETVAAPVDGIGYTPVNGFMVRDGEILRRDPDMNGEVQLRPAQKYLKSKAVYTEFSDKEIAKFGAALKLRDALRELIAAEVNDASVRDLKVLRSKLNKVYDAFQSKHGYLHDQTNANMLGEDPDYPLLLSLENNYSKGITAAAAKKLGIAPEKKSATKAAIFTRRIREPYRPPVRANSAADALAIALNETGSVDLQRMAQLTGRTADDLLSELHGSDVFKLPEGGVVARDAYLSGNVKKKLDDALAAEKRDPVFSANVKALKEVQPPYVEAADIKARLGSTWVPGQVYDAFVEHLLAAEAKIRFSSETGRWAISISGADSTGNYTTWGTDRISASDLIPKVMQGQAIVVRDRLVDGSSIINEEDTALAVKKGQEIAREFEDWLFKDSERRAFLEKHYNDNYNTHIEGRIDGSHLTFPGMNTSISLRKHQKDAVWRAIQDGKILMDHVVGAGKTFAAIAAGMEQKRMGLLRKPLYVVPNHLVSQWAEDFNTLYPGSNVLALGTNDFSAKRRQTFLARIATGDYDAVIVAHSSFGFIQSDPQHEAEMLRKEIADYELFIEELAKEKDSNRTRKQVEDAKVRLEERLKKILDTKQDTLLHFGELGVDGLFVDEAHEFKNLRYYTKLQRVSGLGDQSGSKKAAQLFTKVRYIMERNNGRGVNFLTGTPISNTLGEMFTMQRYLMYDTLQEKGLQHFDSWINNFASPTADYELDPIGNSYKMTTRLREFVNMPEVMALYKSFADVITLDHLKQHNVDNDGKPIAWPVPKIKGGKPENIVVERNDEQSDYMDYLVARYAQFPKDGKADNPLKATSDGRKMALDMRLIDPNAQDHPDSKINEASRQIVRIHQKNSGRKGTQLVFCDLSVPKKAQAKEQKRIEELMDKARKGDEKAQATLSKMSPDEISSATSEFSVYDDLKAKLIKGGIAENEIAFIHDANNDKQKAELFERVRSGKVRVLIGSTFKMGAGMNVQDRLVALHHLDCPWRPSDLEQREGRIIRQGNKFYAQSPDKFEIEILRYATKQTVDARMWQVVEAKAGFIGQVRAGGSGRTVEDVSAEAASFAEMKAAASGNPLVLEEVQLRKEIKDLRVDKAAHDRSLWRYQDMVRKAEHINARTEDEIADIESDLQTVEANFKGRDSKEWSLEVDGKIFAPTIKEETGTAAEKKKIAKQNSDAIKTVRKQAGEYLVEQISDFVAAKRTLGSHALDEVPLLKYGGIVFDIDYFGNAGGFGVSIVADDRSGHNPSVLYMDKDVDDGISATGLMTRLDNILTGILDGSEQRKAELERTRKRVLADGVEARKKVGKEFDGTELLKQKESRHSDVMAELKAAEKENSEKTEAKDFTRWIRLGGPTPQVQPVSKATETLLGLSRPANLSDGEGRLSLPVVESVVSGIVARKKWRDVEIVAVDRFESLPDDVKQGVKTYGSGTQSRGVLHKGTVYVVADEHSTEADVEQTILHEVEGHVGVRRFYGHAATQILKKLYHEIGGNKGISRLAKKRGITELKSYANMLADSEYSDDQRVRIMMEEVFAHMAQSPRFMDKAKALWGAIRKRLRSLGFKRLSEATESDLLYVLSQGRKQLVKSQQAHDDITALRVGRPSGGVGPTESTLAKASPRIKNAVDYLRMKLQDKFIPLLNMQKMLEERGWVKNDANDAYRAEERFHGKAERRLELFTEQYVTPLMEKISGSTISIEELESYLYAKFAPERNKYIASINESMPDGGSGMTNDEARGILAEFQRSGKTGELESLAREVRKITQLQRDIIRNEGLELDETMDAWELNNNNYVPLKGGHEETGRGIGTGYSFKRSGTKQALGRRSKAENILSELFSQAGATIVRAEKAKVQRAFLQMVEQNPDESLWKVYDPRNKATLPTKRKLSNNPVLKRIKRKISKRTYLLNNGNLSETRRAAVEAEIAELEVQASGIKERLVKDVIDPSLLTGDNVMTITRDDGTVVYVDIADNDLARVMKNMTQNQYGPITKALGAVTRYLSRMSTSFNPEFVVTNFERDIQTAMAHLGTEQSGKLAMQVLKSVPKAMGGIRRNLRKGDKTSEWAVWYERFQDAGAQVSFMDLRGVEEWNRQLASLGKKGALDGSKATVKKIGEFINDYNTVVENAVRLSAFKTAIESGMSESDAASMAKNLTVNFNRKGELGPAMNALYMFANAGVQGSARIVQALTNKRSRKRMGKLMGSVVAMSFALAELNRLSAGDDDDDENRWDKIGDYTKQVNLIFATDDGEWKIRTPYGYNSFVALGYALNDLYHYSIGDGGKSPSEVSWFMVSTLKNAFNPLGGDESLMKILSPTITDPIVELTTNENFMGENIRPENFQFGPQKPDSQLYFRTVSQASKDVTGWLNKVTGGSEWEPGVIDVSPETLDHLFGFAFGGVGRSVMRVADLPAKITNGELQVRNVPFARQIYQEKVPYVDFDRFYDNMNKISASRAAVKEMPVNQRRSYIADHPEIRMAKMAGRYNRQLSKMRERYYALKDSGQHKQAKNMQERMQAHVLRFNKVYNGIVD